MVDRSSEYHFPRRLGHEEEREAKEEAYRKDLDICVDDEADPTYQYASDDDDEGYEYSSNDDDIQNGDADIVMEDADEEPEDAEGLYEDWRRGLNSLTESCSNAMSTFLPLSASLICKKEQNFEHIAGPGCQYTAGYNPFDISVEEMRGCKTLQCLVRKGPELRSEKDDEEFELSSDCFLTGISDHMSARDCDSPTVFPARHGVKIASADVFFYDVEAGQAMPFHPTCFEIFKHLSRRVFNNVDVNGLMKWWEIENTYADAYNFTRHEDVKKASCQWWEHYRGAEYLVANPVFVPGLDNLLGSAISTDPSFSVKLGAFSGNLDQARSGSHSNDPFLQLPQELRFYVISYLSSPDIAHLRQCSRAFYQLPISLWHHLLIQERPWLWEAHASSPPSFWTLVSARLLKARQEAKDVYEDQLQIYRDAIQSEMPELLDDWKRAEPSYEEVAEPLEVPKLPTLLPKDKTNWYLVYRNLTIHGEELKGLRNRQRIWTDVAEIVRRIQKYRDEGKIVD
ncbi:MAG: hypothetical protein Q9160_002328 [Pyrenula sp. 1 TL-2023]